LEEETKRIICRLIVTATFLIGFTAFIIWIYHMLLETILLILQANIHKGLWFYACLYLPIGVTASILAILIFAKAIE